MTPLLSFPIQARRILLTLAFVLGIAMLGWLSQRVLAAPQFTPQVASISVSKTVGIFGGSCAATTTIIANLNTPLYYCVVIRNTGDVTFTSHTIEDSLLGINATLPLTLAPGTVVSLTNFFVPGLGPVNTNKSIVNSITVTSTDGVVSEVAKAEATVTIPSIILGYAVGTAPDQCGSSANSLYFGESRYYCVTIENPNAFALSQHTISDPLLNVNFTFPYPLAPGERVTVTNALLDTIIGVTARLGPLSAVRNISELTDGSVHTLNYSGSGDTATVSGQRVTAINSAQAQVQWRPIGITRKVDTVGEDAVALRTISVTVYIPDQTGRPPLPNRKVFIEVNGQVIDNKVTDGQGHVFFAYNSPGSRAAAQHVSQRSTLLSASGESPEAQQACITDRIRLWVDVDNSGTQTGREPQTLAELCSVISLAAFSAQQNADGTVTVQWQTVVERATAGFNLYRANTSDGTYSQINPQLIASHGSGSGASYIFIDSTPDSSTPYYQLEDVDTDSVTTRHGPITVDGSGATERGQFNVFIPAVQR